MQTGFRVSTGGHHRSDVVLNYRLQVSCYVHLGIYTITGRKVVDVQRGGRQPGAYRIRVKEFVSEGFYIVRFQAGGYREHRVISVLE